MRSPWSFRGFSAPVVATAIHAGHDLRPSIASRTALDDATRLREEDPVHRPPDRRRRRRRSWCTARGSRWTSTGPARGAVYRIPDDAWGLELWREPPSDADVERSLQLYDEFYAELGRRLDAVAAIGPFVVLRPALLQPSPRRQRHAGGLGRGEPRGQRRDRFTRPRALGARRRPVHRRARSPRGPRPPVRRAGERPLPGRRAQPLGQRALRGPSVRAGDRVQEGLHGRVDRRARRAPRRGAAPGARQRWSPL